MTVVTQILVQEAQLDLKLSVESSLHQRLFVDLSRFFFLIDPPPPESTPLPLPAALPIWRPPPLGGARHGGRTSAVPKKRGSRSRSPCPLSPSQARGVDVRINMARHRPGPAKADRRSRGCDRE